MKRWNIIKSCEEEIPEIDNFIEEILAVCKKHNFSISHEHPQEAFIVSVPFDEYNTAWFKNAHWEGSKD